jgi:hypothetical protein
MQLRQLLSEMIPEIPIELSSTCQNRGIPRIGPAISASGMIQIHAIIPNSINQIF